MSTAELATRAEAPQPPHVAVADARSNQMPASLRTAITHASDASFLHGLHTAMVVGAGLAIVGALLGLLVQRGTAIDPGSAAA
jgi:hypothetical protein